MLFTPESASTSNLLLTDKIIVFVIGIDMILQVNEINGADLDFAVMDNHHVLNSLAITQKTQKMWLWLSEHSQWTVDQYKYLDKLPRSLK